MNFNRILIFGDIHGRTFWKEAVEKYMDEVEKVIFLGDYLDYYPDEWEEGDHTRKDDIDNLLEIIDLKRKYGNKVILLIGNHDQHYRNETFNNYAGGTRRDNMNAGNIKQIFDEFNDCFQLAYEETIHEQTLELKKEYWEKRVLFTHAGVNKSWYEKHKDLIGELNADNLNKLDSSKNGQLALAQLSSYRAWFGEKTGSMLWADVREMMGDPKECINGIYQIFGHTRLNGKPIITENWACLDCSTPFVLNPDGELSTLDEMNKHNV